MAGPSCTGSLFCLAVGTMGDYFTYKVHWSDEGQLEHHQHVGGPVGLSCSSPRSCMLGVAHSWRTPNANVAGDDPVNESNPSGLGLRALRPTANSSIYNGPLIAAASPSTSPLRNIAPGSWEWQHGNEAAGQVFRSSGRDPPTSMKCTGTSTPNLWFQRMQRE